MTENVTIEALDESFHELINENSSAVSTAVNRTDDQDVFVCCFCGKKIKTKSGHRRHEISHSDTEKRRHECKICHKTFADNAHYLDHMNTHIGHKPFKCGKCNKQYTYQGSYKRHLKVCNTLNAKRFQCSMCPKRFDRKDLLTDHVTGKHKKGVAQYHCQAERKIPHQGSSNRDQSDAGTEGTIKKMHKCNDCDFTTPWPSSLCRHRRIHDQNMFFCDQCDSRFPDLCMLKVHTKHKHGEGLICTHCSKKFTSLAGLNYHLKKISGQYRRKCTYCEKTFISIQHYESHVNKHKNIKPYKCDICQKAFLYKAHLTQHIEKGHSENNEPRTYKCEVCDIILTSKAAHRGHMIGKHSNNVRVCSTCGKSFNWAASYYRHIKSHA
ncbi:Hypothetical predicted protein [Mytilus galloprovincialis]|uniref:C2H2-type domain-containing protein n=1 Tax=Mytilus galloprovincialis TaxID=29158 RepID=A0A8B6E698_MYTGA|nr:Hypothetical predicted protein [Mytilus galloprovincialis]